MRKIFLFIWLIAIFAGCSEHKEQNEKLKDYVIIPESKAQILKLAEGWDYDDMEISGITWYKDWLIVLPQFPHRFSDENDGLIFKISKTDIEKSIKDSEHELNLIPINFKAEGLGEVGKSHGSGYEAITFNEDKVYVIIESFSLHQTVSFIVDGIFNEDENLLTLNADNLKQIPAENPIDNLAQESITLCDDKIFVVNEANGKNVANENFAFTYDFELNFIEKISFPNIEYRITDLTDCKNNTFWGINYLYPGDIDDLNPAEDKIATEIGLGKSHSKSEVVERFLKFEFTDGKITLKKEKPLYLELEGESGRNWEGIVRFDDKGFIAATDKYPSTIIAFISKDRKEN